MQICTRCPPGMVSYSGAASCTLCPWNTTAAANTCNACPNGTFTTSRPAIRCASCDDEVAPSAFCPKAAAVPPQSTNTTTNTTVPYAPPAPLEYTVWPQSLAPVLHHLHVIVLFQIPLIILPFFMLGIMLCMCCNCRARRKKRQGKDEEKEKKDASRRRLPTSIELCEIALILLPELDSPQQHGLLF
jgi:hypothetical protein